LLNQELKRYPRYKYEKAPAVARRIIVWNILSLLLLIALLITFSIDLLSSGSITWSAYAMSGIVGTWLFYSLILFFLKKPSLQFPALYLVTTCFLLVMDHFDGQDKWATQLAVPIVSLLAGIVIVGRYEVKRLIPNVRAVISMVLFMVGLACFGIDFLIGRYLGEVKLFWSIIVWISLFPFSVLFWALSKQPGNEPLLGRFFHT
jgi:drug/metabolite transporter (DMT)-like permease